MEGTCQHIKGCWGISQGQTTYVCESVPALLWQACTLSCWAYRCALVSWLCVSTGIMLGRMGDNGAPLVSFCQCLNESVMKIVAVAVW